MEAGGCRNPRRGPVLRRAIGRPGPRARDAAWVTLDGYHLKAEQSSVHNSGIRLLVVDDHGSAGTYHATIVLDQNIGASPTDYAARPSTSVLLLGSRYSLLRRQFRLSAGSQRIIPESPRRVLITLGGLSRELTVSLIRDAAALALPDAEIVDLVGESSDERIIEILSQADVAIAAAGSTAWELCLLQVPTAYVVLAENQRPVAERLSEVGCALNLGPVKGVDAGRVIDALEALSGQATRTKMAIHCAGLVDGRGADRVVTAMRAELLTLRPAAADDAELLFSWRNDDDVRRWSFNSDEISWKGHLRWFEERLRDSRCTIYIASLMSGPPIGQIRFDRVAGEHHVAEISLSLDPGARGRGLGAALVRAGVRRYRSDVGNARIEAFVKPENRASIESFDLAGFARSPENDRSVVRFVSSED